MSNESGTAPFFEGIGKDYRDRIDLLFAEHLRARGRASLLAWLCTLAALVPTGVAAYLWTRFLGLDTQVTEAQREIASAASGMLIPIGTVVAWSGAVPTKSTSEPQPGDWHYHWHVCDGESISASKHQELANLLSALYGSAGPNLVKLPDFRGYFLRGQSETPADDPLAHGSRPIGVLQAEAVGPHDHTLLVTRKVDSQGMFLGTAALPRENSASRESAAMQSLLAVIECGVGEESDLLFAQFPKHEVRCIGRNIRSETRPANYAVHWIIRVR